MHINYGAYQTKGQNLIISRCYIKWCYCFCSW